VFGVLFANGFFGNSFKDESLFHHVPWRTYRNAVSPALA
jgi:hypothetical protein